MAKYRAVVKSQFCVTMKKAVQVATQRIIPIMERNIKSLYRKLFGALCNKSRPDEKIERNVVFTVSDMYFFDFACKCSKSVLCSSFSTKLLIFRTCFCMNEFNSETIPYIPTIIRMIVYTFPPVPTGAGLP